MQVKKGLCLLFMEHKIPRSQGCITDVTMRGGVTAENVTFQKNSRRGMCGAIVQEQQQFYGILPVQLACNELVPLVQSGYRTSQKIFLWLPMLSYLRNNAQVNHVHLSNISDVGFPNHCQHYLVYACSIGIPKNRQSVLRSLKTC
jgi:hypothetical protein